MRSLEDIQEGKQCGRATGRDVSQRETKSKPDTGLPHEVGPLKSLGEDRGEEGRYDGDFYVMDGTPIESGYEFTPR